MPEKLVKKDEILIKQRENREEGGRKKRYANRISIEFPPKVDCNFYLKTKSGKKIQKKI